MRVKWEVYGRARYATCGDFEQCLGCQRKPGWLRMTRELDFRRRCLLTLGQPYNLKGYRLDRRWDKPYKLGTQQTMHLCKGALMSKWKGRVCLMSVVAIFSVGCAVAQDRVMSDLAAGGKVAVKGNVHGLAKAQFDLGHADRSRMLEGVSLSFHPSAAQQKDLDQFISDLGNPASPHYHKYLTPAQFADRFGMGRSDIAKIIGWLQSEGFTNISADNGRNQISFDGTVAQVESVFGLEMHNYLVNGEVHLANANNPSVPSALKDAVIGMGHLNDFAPKPHVKARPHLTSYVTGNHFLSPADYATIYDINPLYAASITGSTQTIAIVGQSTVSTTDLNNFRSAAGLAASTVTMTLIEGTPKRCAGDETESDLDLEWSGGVAKNAKIIFLYAGLAAGDVCGSSRIDSVWDALHYAVTNKIAPFISTSYGYCEAGLGQTQTNIYRGWAQQAVTQGQTIVAASGDLGAADCEASTSISATTGLAVDVPASIPEVTGAGGNEFTGDAAACPSAGCTNNTAPATSSWGASGTGSDAVSTALSYIAEEAWNDTTASLAANPPGFSASGGGASIYFTKASGEASWQIGTGVPADGQRDVPDISIDASPDHDGYLICSEDGQTGTIVQTCTSGFRTGAGGSFTIVGGTSAAAPTFSASLALVNEYMGNVPPTGLAPINPTLYELPGNNPEPFHDITTGNNIVPCTTGTPNCTGGSLGFRAGVGYDQVTGLGSVDVYNFAQIMARTPTTVTVSPSSSSVNLGANVTLTATVSPSAASGTVSFFNNGSTTALGTPATVTGGTATLTTSSLSVGSNSVTAQYSGDTSYRLSNSATPASVSVASSFTLNSTSTGGTLSVAQGQTAGPVNITVTSTQGFVVASGSTTQTVLPVNYSCTGLPSESVCIFSPISPSQATGISLTITTTAPTSKLERPFERKSGIVYALLMPGLLGIVCMAGSRRRITMSLRALGLIVVLGFSTLWMASCGGTSGSSNKNPGTPVGSSTVVVNATTGGSSPITSQMSFTLTVTP